MFHAESLTLATRGRGTYEITRQIQQVVGNAAIERGLCTVFVHHTSASLIVCENADPSVRVDLERYFARLVPDGDPIFVHVDEGDDDMPAHIRSILTQSSITIPVARSRCDLGTWQGIYLWEHRTAPHQRRITISVVG
ncbi:secondary thiamine-phosphate synthase enzyme YjbQ [Singulisphaera acidiphila]|uniref:Secondary thiamine-phosphate synthase enzyme n=1 Tax=Singulisphaera acidiphila (strain ATCC BAA-1392 / DSM 18658 / VKM B-2454 / MOB10) TaxID=886293 RepID=L0D8S8_SINAD|nr:secondary thiamine-phosphate synthase enzyme YjbQ [Singulisphaera acidiphila]AGA25642.1 secondary thiamine-phosphate synthase enzyme [Singulisphaera acidiphila DSM 18658]